MKQPTDHRRTEVVCSYLAGAIRGEPLPEPTGLETMELVAALRQLLARPDGDLRFHRDLELVALAALAALNARLKAEVHFAKIANRARLQ